MNRLWAIEFGTGRGRRWVNHHTIRHTRREAWQACLDLGGEDPERKWWDEVHARRDLGELRAVKVRIERVSS